MCGCEHGNLSECVSAWCMCVCVRMLYVLCVCVCAWVIGWGLVVMFGLDTLQLHWFGDEGSALVCTYRTALVIECDMVVDSRFGQCIC